MSSNPPTPRGQLDIYLHGALLGRLSDRTVGFVTFDFDDAAIEQHRLGSRILSLSMPVSRDTVDPMTATPFFAGLLPEGEARRRLCEEFQVSPDDPYGLLEVLGRESAGALVIVPAGQTPPGDADGAVRLLDTGDLAVELARLGVAPLGVTVDHDEIRLSLAGVQDKLPLAAMDENGGDNVSVGRLGLPLNGHPSTHIAKPAPRGERAERFAGLVQNEAFCLGVVSALGIPTAPFVVLDLHGEKVLVVERYDRVREKGHVRRLHQEDACQATATNPAFKYEGRGGPSLADVGALIAEHSSRPGVDRITLLRLTIANALLGNCDAHGKNVSFLHGDEGVRLAPAYDVVSTEVYEHTDRLGMKIGGVERLRAVTREAFVAQAEALGIPPRAAERYIAQITEEFPGALAVVRQRAEEEGWVSPVVEWIIEESGERAARMLDR